MEFKTAKEAIIYILANNDISKYELAKRLNMSTATMVNNILTGQTKMPRRKVLDALYKEYGIKIKGVYYEEA